MKVEACNITVYNISDIYWFQKLIKCWRFLARSDSCVKQVKEIQLIFNQNCAIIQEQSAVHNLFSCINDLRFYSKLKFIPLLSKAPTFHSFYHPNRLYRMHDISGNRNVYDQCILLIFTIHSQLPNKINVFFVQTTCSKGHLLQSLTI